MKSYPTIAATAASTVATTIHSRELPCTVVLRASPDRIVLKMLKPAYCRYANSHTSRAPM